PVQPREVVNNAAVLQKSSASMRPSNLLWFLISCCLAMQGAPAQPQRSRADRESGSRRSQRVVPLPDLQIASPNGQVKFTLAQNPERLNLSVTLGAATVLESSPLVMNLDGYDLSSGVALTNLERFELNETYPWFGVHSIATNHCHGARLSLIHDLSFIP